MVRAEEELLQPHEARQRGSWDGTREAAPGEPQHRDATAGAIAAHTFPAAARGAGPCGAEGSPAAELPGEAPQRMQVVGVARSRARLGQEKRQKEEEHEVTFGHGTHSARVIGKCSWCTNYLGDTWCLIVCGVASGSEWPGHVLQVNG